jgi:hypothetical protein
VTGGIRHAGSGDYNFLIKSHVEGDGTCHGERSEPARRQAHVATAPVTGELNKLRVSEHTADANAVV